MSHVGKGALVVVGTGYRLAGQITKEAMACIEKADKVFHICHPLTETWIKQVNPCQESLMNCYAAGKNRSDSYEEMVERILTAVRAGLLVCVAIYGHPGVCADPTREAIRRARSEGYRARMFPGISAEDTLFADLNIDPTQGSQTFRATDFLIRKRTLDTSLSLILWQIGSIGVDTHFKTREPWNREGIKVLQEVLIRNYSRKHRAVVYEGTPYPIYEPHIEEVTLAALTKARISAASTLYVPPKRHAPLDRRMVARLQKTVAQNPV